MDITPKVEPIFKWIPIKHRDDIILLETLKMDFPSLICQFMTFKALV